MKKNVIDYFSNSTAIISFLGRWLAVGLLIINSINAQSAIPEKSFPVMETSRYAFMDAITQYIKGTDLEMVYRTSENYDTYNFAKRDYIYNLHVLRANMKSNRYELISSSSEDQIKFSRNGSYRIEIGTYLIIPDEFCYMFEYNGLTFFSRLKLMDFIVRQYKMTNYKYFLNCGAGFHWSFIIDKGCVCKAYALYSTSQIPHYAYDLKTGEIIPYNEFVAAFHKINH